MKASSSTILLSGLNIIGASALYRTVFSNKTSILMYHGICKDTWNVSSGNWLHVKESSFRSQMEHVRRYYEPISLQEYVFNPDGSSRSGKPRVVVTFDDGYANNYTVAYPILQELEIPATIFLVSSMIDTDNLFWYDKLRVSLRETLNNTRLEEIVDSFKVNHPHQIDDMVNSFIQGVEIGRSDQVRDAYGTLTYKQIHDMQSSGLITFDSHTHKHEIVTRMSNEEVRDSVATSIEVLKGKGIDCGKVFCYPNGFYEQRHFKILSSLGFKAAVGASCDTDNTPFDLRRLGIGQDLNNIKFQCLLSGMWKSLSDMMKYAKTNLLRT